MDGTTYTKVGFLYEDGTYSEEATTGGPVANPCIAFLDDKVLATYHYDGYYDNDRIKDSLPGSLPWHHQQPVLADY